MFCRISQLKKISSKTKLIFKHTSYSFKNINPRQTPTHSYKIAVIGSFQRTIELLRKIHYVFVNVESKWPLANSCKIKYVIFAKTLLFSRSDGYKLISNFPCLKNNYILHVRQCNSAKNKYP